LLTRHQDPRPGIARACRNRCRAEQQAEQRNPRCLACPGARAQDIARCDMAQFVGDDTLYFIGVVGGLDQTRIDINDLSARNKSIDRIIADQHDIDRFRVEPGSGDHRPGHVAKQRLGLGVAEDRLRHRRLRNERHCDQRRDQTSKDSHHASRDAARMNGR